MGTGYASFIRAYRPIIVSYSRLLCFNVFLFLYRFTPTCMNVYRYVNLVLGVFHDGRYGTLVLSLVWRLLQG